MGGADVGADVGPVPGGRGCGEVADRSRTKTVWRASPEFDSYKSPSLFRLFASREMAFPPRFRGSEARSDHDLVVSLAI
jgi:hypothetical protein